MRCTAARVVLTPHGIPARLAFTSGRVGGRHFKNRSVNRDGQLSSELRVYLFKQHGQPSSASAACEREQWQHHILEKQQQILRKARMLGSR
jgi:hypothetical protein